VTAQTDQSLAHLLGRIRIVEARIRRAVAERHAVDPEPSDPFRGLYLSDEAVARLLERDPGPARADPVAEVEFARVESAADQAEADGHDLRLRRLAQNAGLTGLDVELLLVALAPDLDQRYEQIMGYLNDDVTRRRPSVGLALSLCGIDVASSETRRSLGPHAPLVQRGLVVVGDPDRPFLSRPLAVPDRVGAHLLGDDAPDPQVAAVLLDSPPPVAADAGPLSRALAAGVRLVHMRERQGGAGRSLAVQALSAAGRQSLSVDLSQALAAPDPAAVIALIGREALLTGSGIVVAAVPAMGAERMPEVMRALAELRAPVLVVLTGTWDSAWSRRPVLEVDAPEVSARERAGLWATMVGDRLAPDADGPRAISAYLLSPDDVVLAASSAAELAMLDSGIVTDQHLRRGARARNAAGLERLARRLEPAVSWPDLVLPPAVLGQLNEVALRARHRDRVLGDWNMRPGGGRGRGVTALFAGDSGTGKTLSAEVIAADLGLDLYTVDLATVVDKYVGETEKNLERIFTEAAGVNGVLLFDEADAVFGKRSEVKDAHDRYANIESAFLLQRMESFDGLAVLATNLRANIDEAFTRRLDVVIDFPLPDVSMRRALWTRCLGDRLPLAADLDLDFCAGAFTLTGGSIRSIAVTAAYLAAEDGGAVTMVHLMGAVQREYRKLGRLCLESEFGRYWSLLA
jgi:hypothetical protein